MANKILVTRSSMPPIEEYIKEISDMWDSHWLTNMGSKHKELHDRLCDYLDVEHLDLLTNGHMALEFSMQALNLTGEVITTPFTFASTTHAIVRNHCTPIFCDINPDDFTMDVSLIESLITEKTSAIVPVHVYGNVCNIEGIEEIAKKHELKVIYDAAHAFGVRYKGKGIGSFGDVSCFSFHATKVFNTIEGGAVCFQDDDFGKAIYKLKNFGFNGPEDIDAVGANAKMNEFCAAMGICNLKHIDEEIQKRKCVTERYRERLYGTEGIQLNPIQQDVEPNYSYFPVLFDEESFGAGRDEVFHALDEEGIGTRKYFYPLTSAFDCYREIFDARLTPVALRVSEQVLALPLYADLALEDVNRICDIIIGCSR